MYRPLFITWHERNETGIVRIDEQHRAIVSIINTFYHLIGLGAGNNKLYLRISGTIKEYATIHFLTEEGLLTASGYKDLEKHKALHKKLFQELEQIEHHTANSNDFKPLLDFLKRWCKLLNVSMNCH